MNIATFGYSSIGSILAEQESAHYTLVSKAKNLSKLIALVSAVALTILALSCLISPNAALYLGCSSSIVSIILTSYCHYLSLKTTCQNAGILTGTEQILPREGECEALATRHSADTELWRKRLIEAAEENILISGNYCGGNALISLLNQIAQRIQQKPHLKVVLLSSPQFLKGPCVKRLNELRELYPLNFSLITCPILCHVSPGIKSSTNHTKCIVVDYGRYFILGGSGIKDSLTTTGLEDVPKEDFLKAEGIITPELFHSSEKGILDKLLPDNFRDQDWVFSDSKHNHVGQQVYQQLLLLAYRWERLHQARQAVSLKIAKRDSIDSWRLFSPTASRITTESSSITEQLLNTPSKHIDTQVPAFDLNAQKAERVACRIFASGPEHSHSNFADEVLHAIQEAKQSILINHMFFHPTQKLMDALVDGAKRGVRIKIITCGTDRTAPRSHFIFAPRNKYHYSSLIKNLRSGISVYEFKGSKIGYHKKLIVIDEETLILGSSNLGYKSLVTASDHELNMIAKSQKLARETLAICKIDEDHSQQIPLSPNKRWPPLRLSEYFSTAQHYLLAPLIG